MPNHQGMSVVPEPQVPPELRAAIDAALDVADGLAERGVEVRLTRPGAPRRVRVDLRAEGDALCALAASELLALGAGELHVSR